MHENLCWAGFLGKRQRKLIDEERIHIQAQCKNFGPACYIKNVDIVLQKFVAEKEAKEAKARNIVNQPFLEKGVDQSSYIPASPFQN